MTSNAEESRMAQVSTTVEHAPKKAVKGARRPHVAKAKSKPGQKARAARKPPKAPQKGNGAREGSKAAQVLKLLKRAEGATLEDLIQATGWQAHSVRGFLSGTLRKKMGLTVTSAKGHDGERAYSIKG